MAIPDPHAIPESDVSCGEYIREADAAWESGNNDHAYDLYLAVRNSSFAAADQVDQATLRLGLIAQTRGDIDDAVLFLHASHDPAARDALHALTNATTNDPTPTPDQVPQTTEQTFAWFEAGLAAEHAQHFDLAHGLFEATAQSAHATTGQQGTAFIHSATALEHLGQPDAARDRYERSLSLLSDEDQLAYASGRIHALGGGHAEAHDSSPAATQVAAGRIAYENGDGVSARAAFEAAIHLDGPAEEKARAHYYLGAMDYQHRRYADARNHIEAAAAAPEPERGWAAAMLHWRWDEQPAAVSDASPAPTSE
jgi:tetratricopeptide (TPR) repeat protein